MAGHHHLGIGLGAFLRRRPAARAAGAVGAAFRAVAVDPQRRLLDGLADQRRVGASVVVHGAARRIALGELGDAAVLDLALAVILERMGHRGLLFYRLRRCGWI